MKLMFQYLTQQELSIYLNLKGFNIINPVIC